MIPRNLWRELLEDIPVNVPLKKQLPPLSQSIQRIRTQTFHLTKKAVALGVLNDPQGMQLNNDLDRILERLVDVHERIEKGDRLRESFNRQDFVAVKHQWREELKKFLRFRDVFRDAVNTMVLNKVISVQLGDGLKSEANKIYDFFLEVDSAIRNTLR